MKERHLLSVGEKMEFKEVHSDERRTIYANSELLDGKEISIITLKEGNAIGGCYHSSEEYYVVLKGKVEIWNGTQRYIATQGDAGTFLAGRPHSFIAKEDSIVMEYGISEEEKKSNKKDTEMLNAINKINGI